MKWFRLICLILIAQWFFSCKKESPKNSVVATPPVLKNIILQGDTINLQLNSQATITYSLSPANAVADTSLVFSSSDSTIATVKKPGVVTGLKIGTAYITISNTTSTVSAKCVINVLPIAVTAITLNVTSLHILMGTTDSLGATVNPSNATNKTVNWSSSNSNVASVSSVGLLSAVAAGTATITAASQDGKTKATCAVEVDSIGYFVSGTATYVATTVNGGPGEKVYFKFVNNSLYPVNITEWWLYVDGGDIGIVDYQGPPIVTLQRGESYSSIEQSFSIGQYDPGATNLQNWPLDVFFDCLGRGYQMTLTMQGQQIAVSRN